MNVCREIETDARCTTKKYLDEWVNDISLGQRRRIADASIDELRFLWISSFCIYRIIQSWLKRNLVFFLFLRFIYRGTVDLNRTF